MERQFNREYKSTLFSLIYGENKEDLLDLFNAVNGTSHKDAKEIEYTTLESDRGFFLRLKNDLSFIIDRTLSVYEHQSSPTSANIALRLLHYYSDLLRKMVRGRILYREKMVKIPVPQFIVFYNGRDDQADEVIFHLSDLFERKVNSPEIELRVRMLNINYGKNRELLGKCTSLAQYVEFVHRMRAALDNVQDGEQRWKKAENVIDHSIHDGILSEVLSRHRSEVIEMYYWEYDEEAHHWAIEQDAMEKGLQKGLEKGLEKGQALEQIRLVTKKIRKGKSFAEIVDDLESDEDTLRPLWDAVNAEAPDYDEQCIINRLIRNP